MSKKLFEFELQNGVFEVYNNKPEFSIKHVHQVHGANIVEVPTANNNIKADGIIQFDTKFKMCIITADCLPVLIEGELGTCFIHAGWKGLRDNILTQKNVLKIKPTHAFIGPHINADHYEVGKEFFDYFPNTTAIKTKDGKHYFALGEEAQVQLEKAFPNIKVTNSNIDTFSEPSLFSYRENGTSQRNWNVYRPH
jgi:copper oxidase (laccase) domain-containing protein